jgi:hypothetical protein
VSITNAQADKIQFPAMFSSVQRIRKGRKFDRAIFRTDGRLPALLAVALDCALLVLA